MSFLRPSYQGESERNFRVFEAILLGGKMLGFQKSKRKKEIELERERYPSFQKRDAHALRFGSMNSISKVFWDVSRRRRGHLWR